MLANRQSQCLAVAARTVLRLGLGPSAVASRAVLRDGPGPPRHPVTVAVRSALRDGPGPPRHPAAVPDPGHPRLHEGVSVQEAGCHCLGQGHCLSQGDPHSSQPAALWPPLPGPGHL